MIATMPMTKITESRGRPKMLVTATEVYFTAKKMHNSFIIIRNISNRKVNGFMINKKA
jgi:hypothetical protein